MRYVTNRLNTVPGTLRGQDMLSIGHSPNKCPDLEDPLLFFLVLLSLQQKVMGAWGRGDSTDDKPGKGME